MLMIALAIPVIAPQNVNPSGVTTVSKAISKSEFKAKALKKYRKIKKGMTYKQVKAIMGKKGDLIQSYPGFRSYDWVFLNGSYDDVFDDDFIEISINVWFDKGKVEQKQFFEN